jgi:hypothetical protein
MLVTSARAWVSICQHLLSHPLPEAQALGSMVREELGLSAPRLLRHAKAQRSLVLGITREFGAAQSLASGDAPHLIDLSLPSAHPPIPSLSVMEPSATARHAFSADLDLHDNRYAYIGETLRRTAVRFAWEAVAFAEIRDLNRHRTGTKYCPFVPVGFYHAVDELPEFDSGYMELGEAGRAITRDARSLLRQGEPTYVYHTLLGTQIPFEHTTTADKFLYEAELRTGTGAHFRYARHLRDVLALWYDSYPETRGLVLEGSAEPE